tara:strand:+ start:1663 stop:2127 length:465 start_codon:yes stop_codon:yes gene_type:complete
MFFRFKNHINFFFILFFFILMGCKLQEPLKTHGIIFLENRATKLTINQSNKNDTVKILGQPQVKSDEASDSWIYVERILSKGKYHKLGKHVMKENNVLVLHFNKFGILEAKEYYDKDDINKIKFSESFTENQMTRKSFVQKFLQSVKSKMYRNK